VVVALDIIPELGKLLVDLVVVLVVVVERVEEHPIQLKETLEELVVLVDGLVAVAVAELAALEKMDSLLDLLDQDLLVVMVDSVFNFQPHIEILHNRLDILDLLAHIGLLVVEEVQLVTQLLAHQLEEEVDLVLQVAGLMLVLVTVEMVLDKLPNPTADLVVVELKDTDL